MAEELKDKEVAEVAGGKVEDGKYFKVVTNGWVPYIIKAGDCLSQLAFDHGTTVAAIMAANPLIDNPDYIIVGCAMLLPNN